MKTWVLKVELDGEWEQCLFDTRKQALAAFTALASDYAFKLRRAVLIRAEDEGQFVPADLSKPTHFRYVN